MTKRNLPAVTVATRPGVRSDISQQAINRWEPSLRAATDGGEVARIEIMDVIGRDFWGEGVTGQRISQQLRAAGDGPVDVIINSPGGDVFEGLTIYNVLREHKGDVTVKIVGLAASAASIIAMAGDSVQIGRAGFMMIHNSWVCACGDRQALREIADWLEPFDAAMADVYVARSGMAASDIAQMMDAETWMNGTQAVDQGFADDFLDSDDVRVDPDSNASAMLRAERAFDVIARRANVSRSDGKELLASLKGGKPGAALTSTPEAADIAAGVDALAQLVKSVGVNP